MLRRYYLSIPVLGCILLSACSGSAEESVRLDADPSQWNYTDYGVFSDNDAHVEPTPQVQQDRVYEARATEKVQRIGWYPEAEVAGVQEEMLFKVSSVQVDVDESVIFIGDVEAKAVKKFSLQDGRFITQYGGFEGEGPGQSKRPTGFTVMPDGRVLISDASLRRISVFDVDGVHVKDLHLAFRPANVIALNNDAFVVAFGGAMGHLEMYGVFDMDGQLVRSFGKLANDFRLNAGMIGVLVRGDNNIFAHVIGSTGHLLAFSHQQELLYYRLGLDGSTAFPKWTKREVPGASTITFEMDQSNLGSAVYRTLNVWDDELFVLTYDHTGAEDIRNPVDVYDALTGDYAHSILTPDPEHCRMLFLTDQYIFTSCINEGVVKWERVVAS